MNDVQSLSHSKWRCKYHVVFAPKYRVVYQDICDKDSCRMS